MVLDELGSVRRGLDGPGLNGLGRGGPGLDGPSCGASALEAITFRCDEAQLFSPQSQLNASAAATVIPPHKHPHYRLHVRWKTVAAGGGWMNVLEFAALVAIGSFLAGLLGL